MWVRSKYASELAVLAAWVSLLVPWSVAYNTDAEFGSTVFFLRFPLFELQLRRPAVFEDVDGLEFRYDDAGPLLEQLYPGVELASNLYLTSPIGSTQTYSGSMETASIFWGVAAIAFVVAFALSIALYLREEAVVDALPVSQVRVMGALLGIGALGTGIASVFHYMEQDLGGFPIPVGVLVIAAFALVLLQTEEIPDEETD